MPKDIFQKCFEYEDAKRVKEAGLYPYFHQLESRQDVEVIMEGKRRIMLGSNNYLGLTIQPEVVEAGIKALEKYGTGCSGSRFLNGTLDLHIELEKELAAFVRKEEAMTFGTGFQTNAGIISALVGPHDYMICDKEDHASIYAGCRLSFGRMLRFKHNDMEDLEHCLQFVPDDACALVIVDGLFSMGGDLTNLPEVIRLSRKYNARVMVDDAHGLGVLGDGGRGTASHFGMENDVDIIMGTFSKSLASLGGYVAADARVIDYARHNSRPFIFSASIPPASTAIALAALRYLKAHPELPLKLRENSKFARKCFMERGMRIRESALAVPTPVVPLYTYTLERTLIAVKRIFEAGVYVNSVVPPATPEGEALIRTSYMASHTTALIEEAADAIAKVMNELP